jgi:uncharacterized protein YndB with AHSA1/START domain
MKFEFSCDIPAPIQKVWETAQNPSLRPKWDVRVREYTLHGKLEAGTEVSMLLRFPLLKMKVKGCLTHVNAPYQSVLRIDSISPPFFPKGGGTWILTETKDGTKFTSRFVLQPGITEIFLWPSYFWVWRDSRASLKKLKKLVLETLNSPDKGI